MRNSHKNYHILKTMTDLKQILCRNDFVILSLWNTSLVCKIHSLNEFSLNHNKQRKNV